MYVLESEGLFFQEFGYDATPYFTADLARACPFDTYTEAVLEQLGNTILDSFEVRPL